MGEFRTIETQEQFDAAIGDRLKRESEKYKGYLSPEDVESKYKGYLSPEDVETKYKGYLSPEEVENKYKGYISPEDAEKKDAKIRQYESHSVKQRIAKEAGLNVDAADFLRGETEEELKKSAEKLKGMFKHTAPLGTHDGPMSQEAERDERLRETLRKMKER